MQEDLVQQQYGQGSASTIFRVWFGLRIKLAKSIVLCQLVTSKNFGLFSEYNCFMHKWYVFDMSTANDGFGHFAEFWTFLGRSNYYLFYSRSSNE